MGVNRDLAAAFLADPQTTFLATVEVLRTVSDTAARILAERDALAKRVEELESLILDYCGRDTSALRIQILGEAKAIAERRVGRAK